MCSDNDTSIVDSRCGALCHGGDGNDDAVALHVVLCC